MLFEEKIYAIKNLVNEAELLTGSKPYEFSVEMMHHNTEVMAKVKDIESGFYTLWSLE